MTTTFTEVTNLVTGKVYVYSLGPLEAVANAYAQGTRKDYNTWAYGDTYTSQVRVSADGKRYSLGDWVAGA